MGKIIPNISVDCVIFGFDFKQLNVLLVERKLEDEKTNEVILDDWTLTGYHIYEDENLDDAAARILEDISGLENIYLEQFQTFGKTDRLLKPKDQVWLKHISIGNTQRVVSAGYYSLIDSTNATLYSHQNRNVKWFPINQLPELAFDHNEILETALEHLRYKIRHEPVAFELLPEKFTISQLQKLYEAILGTKFDRRNFRKKVLQMKYVVALNEKQKNVKHKPAQLYSFIKEVYLKTKKERYDFSI